MVENADVLDLYERGTAWALSLISRVEPDQLDLPTPCAEWNLGDLLDHMIAGAHLFALAVRGEPGPRPSDFVGSDPARSYADARREALDAFSASGVLTATVTAPFGKVEGRELIAIGFCDHVIHGWDVAECTGQDPLIPDDLANAAWSLAEVSLERFRPMGRFAQRVEVADDASSQDKLIAYAGRTSQTRKKAHGDGR